MSSPAPPVAQAHDPVSTNGASGEKARYDAERPVQHSAAPCLKNHPATDASVADVHGAEHQSDALLTIHIGLAKNQVSRTVQQGIASIYMLMIFRYSVRHAYHFPCDIDPGINF
jgi:hypothetical protein